MKLSLSARIAEGFQSKEDAILSFPEFADVAINAGFLSVCMRASQIGIHSSPDQVHEAGEILLAKKLTVTMITGDFDIVYNNQRGPACLRRITPHLDLAETLGAPLIRVCIKTGDDIPRAQRAADEAAERGLKLVHQCHVQSLFETVEQIAASLRKIDRSNFGLIYEPANLEECRQDYGLETIKKLAPWILNVYLQNQKLHSGGAVTLDTWSHGPVSLDVIPIPARGGIDFARVFEGLKAVGYDGPLTVHQSAPEDEVTSPAEAAKTTAEFLRSL